METRLAGQKETIILVQVRLGSTRLSGKCLRKVTLGANKTSPTRAMLAFLLDRLVLCKLPIVLACPACDDTAFSVFLENYWAERDGHKENYASNIRIFSAKGIQEKDVLSRFLAAASAYPAKRYVRVTGDNPFTCHESLLSIISQHKTHKADLSYYHALPYGSGVEVINSKTLLACSAARGSDREHATAYVHQRPKQFAIHAPLVGEKYRNGALHLTVDTPTDWACFEKRIHRYYKGKLKPPQSLPLLIAAEHHSFCKD